MVGARLSATCGSRLGLANDQRSDAPICRYRRGSLILDVMPTGATVLGFSNRWYPTAFATAETVLLAGTAHEIGLISPAAFVATKLEAQTSRGARDLSMSHDLEDVVAVLDGCPELLEELTVADPVMVDFIAEKLAALAGSEAFMQVLPGFFPPDPASQQRVPRVVRTIERISALGRFG